MNSSKEFNCVFCKETFNNKEDLQIHFRKHGDPKFNPNSKNHKFTPQNESVSNVEKANSAREMVSCDVCSEEFPTISKAITHKHKVHPNHDTKYFCPWCGKLFTMMHLYNKHVVSNHSKVLGTEVAHNNMFHCEPCQVTFYLPGAMLYHNKFFHRQDTEMPAIGHSKLQKFINQELMPIYYCPFCGEEYINKVNLHKHMANDHSDENQSPEEVLRCPLCDALFYHLDAYEVHLTLHSSDDVYREVNEMNKNVKDITEYTLESVPPMREKVEDMEPLENDVNSLSAMGLEEFLQVAMTSGEQEDEHPRKRMKVKKSKKHKKSKKTITLDEFLNMNKDVFGEGLGDVQGIEEVPTQVVAKQLKRKVQQPLKSGTKLMSSDIEKLKKQGIVIKMKSKHNKVPGVNSNATPSTTEKKTSNEVLSKLLNQSNQIKITKTQNTLSSEATDRSVTPKNELLNNFALTPEQNDVNCDILSESGRIPVPDKETTLDDDNEPSQNENKLRHSLETKINKVSQCRNNVASMFKSENNTEVNTECDLEETSDDAHSKHKPGNYASKTINTEEEPVPSKPVQVKTEVIANKTDVRCSTPNNLEKLKKLGHLTIKTSNLKKDTSLNVSQIATEVLKDKSESQPVTDCSSLGFIKQSRDDMCIKYSICDSEGEPTAEPMPKSDRESPIHKSVNSEVVNNKENFSDTKDDDCLVSKTKSELPCTEDNSKDAASIKTSLFKKLYDQLTIKSSNQANRIDKEKQLDEVSNGRKTPQLTLNNVEVTNDKSLDIVKNINSNITIKSVSKLPIKVEKVDSDEDSPKGKSELVTENVNHMKSDLLKSALKSIGSGISIRSRNLNKEAIDQNYHKCMDNPTKCVPKVFIKDLEASCSSELSRPMPSPVNKKIDDNIEIFDVDDSDDEPTIPKPTVNKNLQHSFISNVTCTKSVSQQQNSQVEAIGKIGHNITVRSSNVSSVVKQESVYSEHSNDSKELLCREIQKEKNKSNPLGNNENVHKVLKNLGKHISIKSRNSSPSSSKNDDNIRRESFSSNVIKEEEHSNSGHSQVKIQDVTDDYNSDEETEKNKNVVESPKDSEDENFDEENIDEDLFDVESHIKANELEKINPLFINTLKNISKNVTVKSLNEKKYENSTNVEQNTSKEIVLHNPNKIIDAIQSSDSINKQIKKQGSHSFNKVPRNTKALNETNQEVTVKRFESNTVIQEITTTVTKTIRTVNQTFHKEIQSSTQVIRPRSVAPTFRPNTKFNAFQGVKVRPAATAPVPRLRNPSNIIRPQMPPPVRPPQQLVPVRMSSNTARLSRPRMPAITQKNNPVTVGKQLKVSPNVNINATVKRAAAEEVGHFSCFKKPKESLIPVPDLTMASDMDGASTESYSSTNTSKTDFTMASKTIKGNSVVTSTQMKSDSRVSSQKLNRKNNMSGLKLTKSSQVKQASHVEEGSELDSSRMSTLAAIDKLQKQGLLIKKPRLESNIDDSSGHSCDEAQD